MRTLQPDGHRMEHSPKPLAGLKVVELGTLIAGPFASRICAEFGAEVIKIESPDGGDPLRKWRKLYEGTSLWWFVQARNKKSLTLNLKHAEGQAILKRLLGDADILIENFRPGVLEKLGLGWDVLHALNPRLVMVRLSGFGQTGPQGPAGLRRGRRVDGRTALHYRLRGPPAGSHRDFHRRLDRRPVGVIGALMALRHREVNGGEGQMVDVALYEAIFAMMESMVPEFDVFGFIRERTGNIMPGITPSSIHTSADGRHVQIGANGDAIFRRFMQAIGRDDLASDPRLASNDGAMRAATNSMGLSTAGSPRSPWRKCWRCWREPKSRPAASTPPKTCSAIRNSLPARCSSRHACRTASHSACLASYPSCPPRQARRIG